jgi:hypothetical protein
MISSFFSRVMVARMEGKVEERREGRAGSVRVLARECEWGLARKREESAVVSIGEEESKMKE